VRNASCIALLAAMLLVGCAEHYLPYRFTNFTTDQGALGSMSQRRVAVLTFDDISGTLGAGAELSDQFSIQLGKTGRFDIVERQKVTDLFREQDFDPARLDAGTAVKIGKMLGAHGVIMGKVTEYRHGKVGLTAKLVVVETGEIAWQGSDVISAHDGRVQALVPDPSDQERLFNTPEYLAQVLCQLMAETVK
jgi:PBP1b-binding outer membrane lipoprotein LpoB